MPFVQLQQGSTVVGLVIVVQVMGWLALTLCSLQEACLKRVVEGLQTYTVLLRFVDKQYPNNRIVNATAKLREHLVQMVGKKNPSLILHLCLMA